MSIRTTVGALTAAAVVAALGATTATSATASSATGTADPQVRLTGELVKMVVEPAPRTRGTTSAQPAAPTTRAALRTDDGLLPVEPDAVEEIDPGSTVTLDVRVPDTVVDDAPAADVAAAEVTPAAPGSDLAQATVDEAASPGTDPLQVADVVTSRASAASTASYTPATRSLTVVNVTPAGATARPATTAQIQSMVAGVNTYWRDNSRGTLGVSLRSIKPAYRSAYSCRDYEMFFDEAITRTGFDWRASNQSLVVILPPDLPASLGCGYGLGSIGQNPNTNGVLYGQGTSVDLYAHEIGHNMSLEHSNLLTCSTRSHDGPYSGGTWGNGCSELEYGDGQDIMSRDLMTSGDPTGAPPSPMLSTPQAWSLGLLESSAVQTLSAGKTTRVTLKPLAGRTGLRGATLVNARTGVRYWVEYRTAAGADRYNAYEQTTGVRVLRRGTDGSTVLLDPTPTGDFDFAQALTAGSSLTTYDGHITVRTVSATSSQAVVDITSKLPGTFVSTKQPAITGTRAVGKTLKVSPGSWNPTPTSYSYRWYRGSTAITGATGSTYTPTRYDAGRYLRVRVTARRSGVTSKTVWSNRVGIPIYSTKRPTIGGTTRAGQTLTAYVGSWTPKPSSYAYRWYRDGRVVSGRTSKTYRLSSSDVGRRIKVQVIARRSGFSTGTASSYSTRAITR